MIECSGGAKLEGQRSSKAQLESHELDENQADVLSRRPQVRTLRNVRHQEAATRGSDEEPNQGGNNKKREPTNEANPN